MDFLYVTPRITVFVENLAGIIMDPKDKRFGEMFRVGTITESPDSRWIFITHICTDGVLYPSKHVHPRASSLDIRTNDLPDVAPPELFYRHKDDSPVDVHMRLQGKGFDDLIAQYHSLGTRLRVLRPSYATTRCFDTEHASLWNARPPHYTLKNNSILK